MYTFSTLNKTLRLALIIAGISLAAAAHKSYAQGDIILYVDTLNFTIDPVDAQLYTFPIRVINFDSVAGISLNLSVAGENTVIDTAYLDDFGGLNNLAANLNADSILIAIFLSQENPGLSIGDDEVFFFLRVRLVGVPGDCFSLTFNQLEIVQVSDPFVAAPSMGIGAGLCVVGYAEASGEVVYANASMTPLDSVEAHAVGPDSIYTGITDAAGQFVFPDLPTSSAYDIVALTKLDEDSRARRLQGVNVGDIAAIRRHLLQITLFSSPYQYIAADVNSDEAISILDLVQLQDYILLRTDEFANNTYWRFIDADYVFPDPANPFLEPFPELISTGVLLSDQSGLQFKAVKVGDANLNAY